MEALAFEFRVDGTHVARGTVSPCQEKQFYENWEQMRIDISTGVVVQQGQAELFNVVGHGVFCLESASQVPGEGQSRVGSLPLISPVRGVA